MKDLPFCKVPRYMLSSPNMESSIVFSEMFRTIAFETVSRCFFHVTLNIYFGFVVIRFPLLSVLEKRKQENFGSKFILLFFFLGFLSRTFTNHKTEGKRGGYFFNSSLPLSTASQTLAMNDHVKLIIEKAYCS